MVDICGFSELHFRFTEIVLFIGFHTLTDHLPLILSIRSKQNSVINILTNREYLLFFIFAGFKQVVSF